MSVLQIVDDWHDGRMYGLNDLVASRTRFLREAERKLEDLIRERDCPERQCSLQRPGQRTLEAISQEMVQVNAHIKRRKKRMLRATKRRDKVLARRQLIHGLTRSFVVHQ